MENASVSPRIQTNSAVQVVTILLLVVGSFLLGSLWQRVQFLEKSGGVAQTPSVAGVTQNQTQTPTVSLNTIKDLFKKDLVKLGDVNKKVLFVEVADPSCPYCHVAAGKDGELNKQVGSQFTLVEDGGSYVAPVPEIKKLVDAGKAGFVYIYYPGHGNGEMGVKALYCAADKGKFWEVHDLLMNNKGYEMQNTTVKNDKTKSKDLAEFLNPAMNANDMQSCLDSGKYDQRPAQEQQLSRSLGVTGTPGFFVNSTVFGGAYSYKDMESAVATALK